MSATPKRPGMEISFLAMEKKPNLTPAPLEVLEARNFPAWYFLALYDAVGADYYWLDMHQKPRAEVDAFCADARNTLYTLWQEDGPAGFAVSQNLGDVVEIRYFGLVAHAIHRRLGGVWLDYVLSKAWAAPETQKVIVDTCTLDHPRALPLYLSRGFVVTHKEERDALW